MYSPLCKQTLCVRPNLAQQQRGMMLMHGKRQCDCAHVLAPEHSRRLQAHNLMCADGTRKVVPQCYGSEVKEGGSVGRTLPSAKQTSKCMCALGGMATAQCCCSCCVEPLPRAKSVLPKGALDSAQ
jgi:hypothetical protein